MIENNLSFCCNAVRFSVYFFFLQIEISRLNDFLYYKEIQLNIDRLNAVAIEVGARARHTTL